MSRRILDATVATAADVGLDELTISSVARQADVAERTVYNHFGTRDDLVAAALHDLALQTRAQAMQISVDEAPAREQISSFVGAFVASYAAQGEGGRVLMAALESPAVADVVREVRTWRRSRIEGFVDEAVREDRLQIGTDEAVTIAYTATAYATFATLCRDVGMSVRDAQSLLRTMVDRSLFAVAD